MLARRGGGIIRNKKLARWSGDGQFNTKRNSVPHGFAKRRSPMRRQNPANRNRRGIQNAIASNRQALVATRLSRWPCSRVVDVSEDSRSAKISSRKLYLLAVDDIFATTGVKLEVKLDRGIDEITFEDLLHITGDVKTFALSVITYISMKSGSVRLVIEIKPEDAKALTRLFREGSLKTLGGISIAALDETAKGRPVAGTPDESFPVMLDLESPLTNTDRQRLSEFIEHEKEHAHQTGSRLNLALSSILNWLGNHRRQHRLSAWARLTLAGVFIGASVCRGFLDLLLVVFPNRLGTLAIIGTLAMERLALACRFRERSQSHYTAGGECKRLRYLAVNNESCHCDNSFGLHQIRPSRAALVLGERCGALGRRWLGLRRSPEHTRLWSSRGGPRHGVWRGSWIDCRQQWWHQWNCQRGCPQRRLYACGGRISGRGCPSFFGEQSVLGARGFGYPRNRHRLRGQADGPAIGSGERSPPRNLEGNDGCVARQFRWCGHFHFDEIHGAIEPAGCRKECFSNRLRLRQRACPDLSVPSPGGFGDAHCRVRAGVFGCWRFLGGCRVVVAGRLAVAAGKSGATGMFHAVFFTLAWLIGYRIAGWRAGVAAAILEGVGGYVGFALSRAF